MMSIFFKLTQRQLGEALQKALTDSMRYPLPETIGDPDLLVGRKKEFARLDKWIGLIPRRGAK